MSYQVSPQELAAVTALPSAARYQYFLNKVADWEELWSVGDDEGWALMSDGVTEVVPIWPAAAFAQACCVGGWRKDKPRAIALDSWLEKWTPGLIKDQHSVSVFPLSNGSGPVVTPERLQSDLSDALKAYE